MQYVSPEANWCLLMEVGHYLTVGHYSANRHGVYNLARRPLVECAEDHALPPVSPCCWMMRQAFPRLRISDATQRSASIFTALAAERVWAARNVLGCC